MNKMSIKEKCFALLCNKKIHEWKPSPYTLFSAEKVYQIHYKSWLDFWKRMGQTTVPDFSGKIIVDYGCGWGYDSLFMLQGGARQLYCLDVSERFLTSSQALHEQHGFFNVTYILNNAPAALNNKITTAADVVLCKNVMEHVSSPIAVLDSIYMILNTGGIVYIGFSPFYKSPWGAHIQHKCWVPWVHLLFGEETIINVLTKLYSFPETVTKYADIEGIGVNKLSYYDYLSMTDNLKMAKISSFVNQIPDKKFISFFMDMALFIVPFRRIKELFIISSYIVLLKSNSVA